MQHVERHLPLLAEGGENLKVERVGGGEAVDGEPIGKVELYIAGADWFKACRHQFGQRRDTDLSPHEAPQPRLPGITGGDGHPIGAGVLAEGPGPDHLGPAPGVGGEEAAILVAAASRLDSSAST